MSLQRNGKRKSNALDSDAEAKAKPKGSKKIVVDSDEDDDGPVIRRKRPRKSVAEERDSELEAMMAMSDDNGQSDSLSTRNPSQIDILQSFVQPKRKISMFSKTMTMTM